MYHIQKPFSSKKYEYVTGEQITRIFTTYTKFSISVYPVWRKVHITGRPISKNWAINL